MAEQEPKIIVEQVDQPRTWHKDSPAPIIPPDVVAWLQSIFPDSLPSETVIETAHINVQIGEQQVIRRLARELNKQTGD